jgi:hypothetical protein
MQELHLGTSDPTYGAKDLPALPCTRALFGRAGIHHLPRPTIPKSPGGPAATAVKILF